jgi:hypothetical protein
VPDPLKMEQNIWPPARAAGRCSNVNLQAPDYLFIPPKMRSQMMSAAVE